MCRQVVARMALLKLFENRLSPLNQSVCKLTNSTSEW
jgi:hypothetical protein